jgi:hypothetical protein
MRVLLLGTQFLPNLKDGGILATKKMNNRLSALIISPLVCMINEVGIGKIGNRESLSEYVNMSVIVNILHAVSPLEAGQTLIDISKNETLKPHYWNLIEQIMGCLYRVDKESWLDELIESDPFFKKEGLDGY